MLHANISRKHFAHPRKSKYSPLRGKKSGLKYKLMYLNAKMLLMCNIRIIAILRLVNTGPFFVMCLLQTTWIKNYMILNRFQIYHCEVQILTEVQCFMETKFVLSENVLSLQEYFSL